MMSSGTFVLALFLHVILSTTQTSTHGSTCNKSSSKSFCTKLSDYNCSKGHNISYSGCDANEICCSPYVDKEATYEAGVDQCGVTSTNHHRRVVGGISTDINDFPWMVSLQTSHGHKCGASIISENWVLTAAHCIYNEKGVESKTTDISLVVGSTTHKLSLSSFSKRHMISKILRHKNYESNPTTGYDIALLKVTRPFTLGTKTTRRICLPEKGESFANRVCTASGWGLIMDPNDYPDFDSVKPAEKLRQVDLPVLDKQMCDERLKSSGGSIDSGMLCAGYVNGGRDVCTMDSGGPLVCQDKNGVWKQAGVVSWGRGCATSVGFYVETAHLHDWIQNVMKNN